MARRACAAAARRLCSERPVTALAAVPSRADSALRTIEAQRQADEVVRRLCAGEIDSEALAIELAKADGEIGLQALARSLTKAVQR